LIRRLAAASLPLLGYSVFARVVDIYWPRFRCFGPEPS